MNEVTVSAYSQKDKPLNTIATVSARSFSVEDTRRYAGGLDDPARMASSFVGVFDMKFRTGNNERREYTFQAGVLGIDISSEGPFKTGSRATYLFNYRYSTFGIIKTILPPNMGIPDYQDLSFKLNFPNKHGSFSVWGIGSIDNYPKPEIKHSTKWETEDDRTSFDWHLKRGAIGIAHKLLIGENTYINTMIAGTGTLNKKI